MKFAVLITDGFGREGGIALYNRYLLSCLCEMSQTDQVSAFSLLAPETSFETPSNLQYFTGSKPRKARLRLNVTKELEGV